MDFHEALASYKEHVRRYGAPTFEDDPTGINAAGNVYLETNGRRICSTCGFPQDLPGYIKFAVPVGHELFGKAIQCPDHER